MKTVVGVLIVIVELLRGLAGLVITLALVLGVTAALILALLGAPPEQVTAPSLRGMTVPEAEEKLTDLGLKLKVSGREHHTEVPEGRIIRSEPYAGKRVKRGRAVQCVMSLGPRTVTVPKVTGLTIAAAERRLLDVGLAVEEIRRKASETARDEVLRQYPPAGAKIGRKQSVVLVASGGQGFGIMRASKGPAWIFKRLRITVPRGVPLQRVQVLLRQSSGDEVTAYDRVHKPGDQVRVKIVGRRGSQVRVKVVDRQVFEGKL